jgi:primosomal protein N' (replication factor Y)
MQERFEARFPGRCEPVSQPHDRASAPDPLGAFACAEADIAVGARSVVFAPAGNLGLIVVDEEHERSFKQEDGFKYHARDAAVMRGKIEKVPVILGSATPSIESYANCIKGKYALLPLTRRVEALAEPQISFVDMATERDIRKRGVVLSRPLVERIAAVLGRGEQVLLFLNRRGYSTASTCPHCGWQLSCLHCSIILTYHKTHERAYCHICGYSAELRPAARSAGPRTWTSRAWARSRSRPSAAGKFPAARIRRIDTDSVKGGQDFEAVYRDVLDRKIDILVGTQMLAKGCIFRT